ncbi:S-adenosyl-L-methionine-dependent methyltransferase [Radiomyces spectabilis]|uniref:S-adenosyl-L-methionine-dependent methyltransferase n=1 Tax=Radiomyces spectabilis TaxID=64574 RepID=UPI00221E5FB4|nr:S-adenosyl-L-methionine-dependent methyltransferase [Radiomyces spectabilis]KAI8366838.1 S-adenosyl-L-methionine-dependent methyltransferase [Radiomyces spectabilis]
MGCGSGSWVMEMAIENPEARVTGIDMADIFPTTIRPENVRFEIVNILDGLPFEDNTFDLVHMRLLVAALRVNEWPRVLNEIHRVLKPGGLVELVESDFTETEQSPKIRRFISAFLETMQERQQDPWISRKLSTLLQDSSFEVLQDELKEIHFGPDQNAIATEILWGWKEAMKTLKPLLSAKLCPNNEDYIALVDDYIKDCIENRWFVRCVAASGRKI